MYKSFTLLLLALLLALSWCLPALADAHRYAPREHDDVDVYVTSDTGRRLPMYPLRGDRHHRAYLEAERGMSYTLHVRNNTGRRVGLVIAVDGRNIVTGRKSHLARDERKYILDAYEQASYQGWRTGRNQVNRFYFTDAGDSYADAWGDRSAMGVIAVAVYREQRRRYSDEQRRYYRDEDREGPGRQRAESRSPSAAPRLKSAPGTGFGEETYSPSVQVRFTAQRRASSKHFIKYEWRPTLCRRGIAPCDQRRPRNRFWKEDSWDQEYQRDRDFAPYPPRQRY